MAQIDKDEIKITIIALILDVKVINHQSLTNNVSKTYPHAIFNDDEKKLGHISVKVGDPTIIGMFVQLRHHMTTIYSIDDSPAQRSINMSNCLIQLAYLDIDHISFSKFIYEQYQTEIDAFAVLNRTIKVIIV